jgi:hypothetical protein
LKDFYLWVPRVAGELSWRTVAVYALAAVAFFGIGILFFYFRLRLRSVYGLLETAAGILIGVNKFSGDTSHSTELVIAILTASIYLVVRGLDNVYTGLTDPKARDPVALALLKRFGIEDISREIAKALQTIEGVFARDSSMATIDVEQDECTETPRAS